jgi:hypothetical protein
MKTETNGRGPGPGDLQLAAHIAQEHSAATDRLSRSLEHIAELSEAQAKRSRLFTSMFTSSIATAGQLFANLHLPEESAIAGAYIENNSAIASLTVYEGAGAGGRVIGVVPPSHSKRIAISDHISSLSVVADKPDPGPAIVVVTLTTRHWSPQQAAL